VEAAAGAATLSSPAGSRVAGSRWTVAVESRRSRAVRTSHARSRCPAHAVQAARPRRTARDRRRGVDRRRVPWGASPRSCRSEPAPRPPNPPALRWRAGHSASEPGSQDARVGRESWERFQRQSRELAGLPPGQLLPAWAACGRATLRPSGGPRAPGDVPPHHRGDQARLEGGRVVEQPHRGRAVNDARSWGCRNPSTSGGRSPTSSARASSVSR